MGIEVVIVGFVLVGLGLLHLLYQLVTKGFIGSAFGAHVVASFDRIAQSPDWFGGGHVRVHRLSANGRKQVGIRVVCTSWLGWEELFLRLTNEDARRLAETLEHATEQR